MLTVNILLGFWVTHVYAFVKCIIKISLYVNFISKEKNWANIELWVMTSTGEYFVGSILTSVMLKCVKE